MNKDLAFNPYLPSYEYVPDGEPYLFEGRVYLYGSHDAFSANGFCVNDYVCYSASPKSLGNWNFEGIIYKKTQDPLNKKGKQAMNAPDVCQGGDGRYYLYYQLEAEKITSVAVADRPNGPFEFYGHVHHKNGKLFGKSRKEAFNFDPGVLMDEDGKVYMYTGFSPADQNFMKFMKLRGGTYFGGTVVELESDMVTVKGPEIRTVPGELYAGGTEFEGHGFFEASSIRKINGIYYLVYSSFSSHDLCYATARSPLGPFRYGGVLISIGDVGYKGITEPYARNFTGNTHGGMIEINGQWYIFYHRQTNQQKCARQGCAEKILIKEDGSIDQVEITSCGLNEGALPGIGYYESRIACNLWGEKGTFAYVKVHHKENEYPYFTQTGSDREDNPDQYIAGMKNGAVAGFKYFDFNGHTPTEIEVTGRATGVGKIVVSLSGEPFKRELEKDRVCTIECREDNKAGVFTSQMLPLTGICPLYFRYEGEGSFDFFGFDLIRSK